MNLRPFNALTDYAEIRGWWEAHKWDALPLSALPATGLVVENQGLKLCAGWLYRTDSSFAILEWVVGNPASDKMMRGKALDLLISSLTDAAKEAGFSLLLTMTHHPNLMERYQEHGFVKTDTNMTHFIRRLN